MLEIEFERFTNAVARRLGDDPAAARQLGVLLGRAESLGVEDHERIEAFIADVAVLDSSSPQVFVVVHHGNFPHVEYLAAALRERGRPTIGIYLQSAPPEGVFSAVFDCRRSLAQLVAAVQDLASNRGRWATADAWYVQAHGRWCFLSALLAEVVPDVHIVQELWDWMDLFVMPGSERAFVDAGVFGVDELALIRAGEHYVRTAIAGFLYKNGGPAMERLLARATVPSRAFLPCPPRAWLRSPKPDRSLHSPPRLVHAGQLKNADAPVTVFGDIMYHEVVPRLCAQGLELTAYGSATPETTTSAIYHHDYHELARIHAGFCFHDHLPVESLIDRLAGACDFGLIFYRFPPELCIGSDHLDSAIASKLFTYLAAGLPVIVSPELRRMADFVRDHGVGLVVPWSQVDSLRERIEACDYAALCRRVAAVQSSHHLECFVADTLAFIEARGHRSARHDERTVG